MRRRYPRAVAPRFYEERVLPALTDYAMRGDELNALRARTLAPARGRLLEVGFGTGLNARHYGAGVQEIVVVDNNAGMTKRAHARIVKAGRQIEHRCASGERLPCPDRSFDTVVITFTLCSIADVVGALREVRRVLRHDGQLLFCEHNLSDDARIATWQRRLTPLWRPFTGGCHLDRDAPPLLSAAGFAVEVQERMLLSTTSPILGTIRRGVAHPR